ncbi:MAG: hypothetical protein HYT07_01595 [Candidatus Levybacteria bacterium]|nr:hypothetical protein [Candidatus Levybacteria bacterium]
MDNENGVQKTWNKKRIFIAIFLIILLGIGTYFLITKILEGKINFFNAKPSESPKSVKGISVVEDKPSFDIEKALKEKIDELKKEASKIDVEEIASSSPQIQKLIKDLNSLKEYPTNQAKEICQKVCSGL